MLIVFNLVRFRLRLGCPGNLMSLYGPTFHVTPVDLCIIFQCNIYINAVSCLVDIKSFQIVSNSFKIVSNSHSLKRISIDGNKTNYSNFLYIKLLRVP